MFHRRETQHTLGERGILGDEAVAELLTTIEQLRAEVGELRDRVDSQFTTIAAHAEIARQQAEFARGEARADLDRSRDTLIGLIEQVRSEREVHEPGSVPGPSAKATNDRIAAMERRIAELTPTAGPLLRSAERTRRHDDGVSRHGSRRAAGRTRRRPVDALNSSRRPDRSGAVRRAVRLTPGFGCSDAANTGPNAAIAPIRCECRPRPTRGPSGVGRSHGPTHDERSRASPRPRTCAPDRHRRAEPARPHRRRPGSFERISSRRSSRPSS